MMVNFWTYAGESGTTLSLFRAFFNISRKNNKTNKVNQQSVLNH